jgi:hypothetical protein
MELTRLNIARAVLMFDVKHIEADVPPLCHISMNIPLMVHAPMGKGLLYMGTNRMRTLQFFAILLRLSFLESLLLKPLPIRRSRTTMPLFDSVNQSKDALRILVDFHEGTWTGKATSFSITNDLSAGIRMRKVSPEYKSTIKVGLDLRNQEYTMTETLEWESKMKRRQLSLIEASMDVDTVDGSYSLDTSLPDLPEDLIGTKKILQFGIEHCIAVNDNARVRAFAFYGIDQSLARIVICLEERFLEAANPLTMETIRPSTSSSSVVLSPAPINILELTSGVWLGDMILREPAAYQEPKGFDRTSTRRSSKAQQFASWSIGVQKVALQWKWDMDESIQKLVSVGKPLGVCLPTEMAIPISGVIGQNECLSNGIPTEQRMVYMDWMGGEQVGFIINNVALQVRVQFWPSKL